MTEQKVGPNPAFWPRGGARVEALQFRRAPLLAAAAAFGLGEVMASGRVHQPAVILLVMMALFMGMVWVALRGSVDSLRVAVIPVMGFVGRGGVLVCSSAACSAYAGSFDCACGWIESKSAWAGDAGSYAGAV